MTTTTTTMTMPLREKTIYEKLQEWQYWQSALKTAKEKEMELRKQIFNQMFPAPKEGTNTIPLENGWKLKAAHKLIREMDIATFTASKEKFAAAGINSDVMVQYKPQLVLAEYRTLTAEQAAVFDNCLVIKPGAPDLELVAPKEKKTK